MSAPVLRYPDPKLQYILDMNASAVGVETALSQIQEKEERVIAHYSKTLASPERYQCVTHQELLVAAKTVKHFPPIRY